MRRIILSVTLLLPVFALAFDWSTLDLTDSEHFAQGQITVRFADYVDLDAVQTSFTSAGTREISRIQQLNVLRLELSEGTDILETIDYYQSRPDVLYAEPVMIQHVHWTPNDPLYSFQWHFQNLDMETAWDTQRGSSGVVVAIVDSGVAFEDYLIPGGEAGEVESSSGYYNRAPDFTSSQFVSGYDFVHLDNHPNDQNGHGTHVAGTVAQATNNGLGTAGMAHNCRIMPVQVMEYDGSGYDTDIADGIIWAADNGADVINLSLGGDPGIPSQVEHDAVIYATNKDVVVVASAGNDGVGILSYPAGFSECIAVAAVDINNDLSYYSQYGDGLDISAPGGDVNVDLNGDSYADGVLQCTYYTDSLSGLAIVDSFGYWFWQGTSMAAPHVSALAALLISHGVSGVSNVKNTIYNTATDLGSSGYDTRYGYGLIDPVAALGGGGPVDLVYEVPVLQNPLLSQYIDIWVVPTSGNITSSPQVNVTLDGAEQSVTMMQVSGTQNYVGDYKFAASGTATIDVSAGGVDKTRTFSVNEVVTAGGWFGSVDGRLKITIPEGAVNQPTYFTVIAEQPVASSASYPHAIPEAQGTTTFGPAYRIGPGEVEFNLPADLRISYEGADADPRHLVIMRYRDGIWEPVPCYLDRDNAEIAAIITSPGIFQLAQDPDHNTPQLPGTLELTMTGPYAGTVRLMLNQQTSLSLDLYNASGRRVSTITRGDYPPGEHEVSWERQQLPGGTYFCVLKTPSGTQTLKLIQVH